jgi:hypothetical protein
MHSPTILSSALDGGEWSASLPFRFTPRGKDIGTHLTGGRVGTIAGLEAVE